MDKNSKNITVSHVVTGKAFNNCNWQELGETQEFEEIIQKWNEFSCRKKTQDGEISSPGRKHRERRLLK